MGNNENTTDRRGLFAPPIQMARQFLQRLSHNDQQAQQKESFRLNRRQLLIQAAASAIAVEALHLSDSFTAQEITEHTAHVPSSDFFQIPEVEERRKTVSLGTSFSPEEFGVNRNNFEKDGLMGKGAKNAMECLRFAVEELGMKEIRLGIRWNQTVDDKGNIDLNFYDPFIQYCIAQGVKICLNVGPIKTFRWPEEHIPSNLISPIGKPNQKEIEGQALTYLGKLLPALHDKYGDAFAQIQPENEAFNAFGQFPWKENPDYLREVVRLVHQNLSKARILFSDPGNITGIGTTSLDEMRSFITSLQSSYGDVFDLGYNYYHQVPGRPAIVDVLDSTTITQVGSFPTVDSFRSVTEITEMQAEPWGNFTDPGNNREEFQFALLRSLQSLPISKHGVIRMWGIEHLSKIWFGRDPSLGAKTRQHEEIVQLIKQWNNIAIV